MKKIKERAFILRCTKYSEADLIVRALNQSGSQISLIARSALKSKKRFGGGVLEPTHFVELSYSDKGHAKGLLTLDEAQLLEPFAELRKDYDRLEQALFVMDTVCKASQEHDFPSADLFNMTGNSLRTLEKIQNKPKSFERFRVHFGLKLLMQQGVLEPEAWMQVYLKTAIADHASLEAYEDAQVDAHRIWIENKIKEYLSTGALSI